MNFREELYYIVPIAVVENILSKGILSHNQARNVEHATIANPVVQDIRERVTVPNGLALHDYVNLYFDAHNPMMCSRQGEADKICVLVVSKDVLNIPGTVISDRNASSRYARFYPSPGGLKYLDYDLIYSIDWRDPNKYKYYEKKSCKCAELLVPHRITSDYIKGAIVANAMGDSALTQTSFSLTISVNPGMFYFGDNDD